jgi:hypothetical protein
MTIKEISCMSMNSKLMVVIPVVAKKVGISGFGYCRKIADNIQRMNDMFRFCST